MQKQNSTLTIQNLKMQALFATSSLPCIAYFELLKNTNKIVIDSNELYKKQSLRNRYHILTANGIQMLSIPLQHNGIRNLKMNEVKISYQENWQRQHWRSIESAYNNSAFFIFYKDSLGEIFHKKEDFLFQYNLNLLEWCLKSLKIDTKIHCNFDSLKNLNELNDYRNLCDLNMTNSQFESTNFKKYPQVFSYKFEFTPNLSILDLLFNNGPQAIDLL